ncbi:MAG: beta-xylosidase [Phycisphaerae bacterium]|nr:beta-xylosidase [Phycisphaerae bacterium]
MITGFMLWNEPNNLSHWDFLMDPEWKEFSEMTRIAAARIKSLRPDMPLILGGISPIDPSFIQMLDGYGTLEHIDAIGIHGFPLDWNHWMIYDWPAKVAEIERVTPLPVWVTEIGASSFGADEVQVFGLRRTQQLLVGRVENIFWYSLFDLPPAWGATTRHKEAEGSSYYRHFYLGLIRADGSPKPALEYFEPTMDICQWFHYEDHRLDEAVKWLRALGVRRLRTGISWADWHRPDALRWFDRQMKALDAFDVIVTLCFTPPSKGKRPCYTSPPVDLAEFADFAGEVVERYCPVPVGKYPRANVYC